jgi:AraC-like DNA-binding protein
MDMLNALRVRKYIVQVLEEQLLPAFLAAEVVQVYAGVPLQLVHVEHWPLFDTLLPDKDMQMQLNTYWKKQGVLQSRMPMLSFVYHGISDERIGVTESMATELRTAGHEVPPGVTAYRLHAPAAFYVPAYTPRNLGRSSEQEKLQAHPVPVGILSCDLLEKEVLVRVFESHGEGMHLLHVSDPALPKLALQYAEHLKRGDSAQSQRLLGQFLQQVRHALIYLPVPFANSSWPPLCENFAPFEKAPPKDQEFCLKVITYIQTHLHSPLTRELLACEMGVSASYLNRVFLRTMGMTIMRFVTWCRVEAAKFMLCYSRVERIGEIATLVGFAHAFSFNSVFTREVGLSPSAYRKKNYLPLQPGTEQETEADENE